MGNQSSQNRNGAQGPGGRQSLIIGVVGLLVMLFMAVYSYNYFEEEERRDRHYRESHQLDSVLFREHLAEQQVVRARQQWISDSIARANAPRYSLESVRQMVRARVPSYSWIYLWRLNNDEWIMRYMREYGGKEHWFMQRFNPTTRHFERAREYATVAYRSNGSSVNTRLPNARCRFTEHSLTGSLEYYEDDDPVRYYSRRGIESICLIPSTTTSPLAQQRIRALRSAPDYYYDDDDDDDDEDEYNYDYDEDLYYYYGE